MSTWKKIYLMKMNTVYVYVSSGKENLMIYLNCFYWIHWSNFFYEVGQLNKIKC